MNVAVIGAGAVGTTLAFDLATRDADVTLYERGSVAAGSSGRASGLCYDAWADRVDADLAGRALERLREFDAITDCPYVWMVRATDGARMRATDGVRTREDDDHRRAMDEAVSRMRDHGLDVTIVSSVALAERFPHLRTADVEQAAVVENAGYADPATHTEAMAARAVEAGVDLRTNTPISLQAERVVETPDGTREFDAVVVAAGAHTRQVLAGAGHPVPLKPYRVQALTTASGPDVPMCYDATGGYYLRPYGDGVLVGDGTEPVERDPDDWDPDADDWFVADCAGYMETAFGEAFPVERAWAGLCVATPDGDPLVGELGEGLYVAAGWQGSGFMRSPATAERLAEEVCGGEGIAAFDPTRFDGDEAFDIVEGNELRRG
jgi:sarcosine oxidase subunit beta